jgi:hypothetical protein
MNPDPVEALLRSLLDSSLIVMKKISFKLYFEKAEGKTKAMSNGAPADDSCNTANT